VNFCGLPLFCQSVFSPRRIPRYGVYLDTGIAQQEQCNIVRPRVLKHLGRYQRVGRTAMLVSYFVSNHFPEHHCEVARQLWSIL
jgi:hypothetical protein